LSKSTPLVKSKAHKEQYQEGFTLLEILLVLVLMSLASIAVISSLPSHIDRSNDDIKAMYQRIHLLQEDAILSSRSYGIFIHSSEHSVQFFSFNQERWDLVSKSMMNPELHFSNNVSVSFKLGANVWLNKERLYVPKRHSESSLSEEEDVSPQIVIYSNGMMTPFELSLTSENGLSSVITASDSGELTLEKK